MAKQQHKKTLIKIVNEQFYLSKVKGGGMVKIEAWKNTSEEIVKYSMAYINHTIFSKDNGRVIGYDNSHAYHHRHYFGKITPLTDFTSYENQVSIFEKELREIINEHTN